MTISMHDIRPFDVLVASVQFEDKPELSKPRPVVVLSVNEDSLSVVALKVTSHAPRQWCSGKVVLLDWQAEGLLKPSVARCSKRMSLKASALRGKIGTLTSRDRASVIDAVSEG